MGTPIQPRGRPLPGTRGRGCVDIEAEGLSSGNPRGWKEIQPGVNGAFRGVGRAVCGCRPDTVSQRGKHNPQVGLGGRVHWACQF